jgi:hypothetical protein
MASEVHDRADQQIEDLLKSLKSPELGPMVNGLMTYGHLMGLYIGGPAAVHIRPTESAMPVPAM